jgi:hypothetical protein
MNTAPETTATTMSGKINSTFKMGFAMLTRRSSTKSSEGESTSRILRFGRRRKRPETHLGAKKAKDGRNSEVNGDKIAYRSSSDMDSDVSDDSVRLHRRRMSCPEAMMRKAQLQLLAEVDNGFQLDDSDEVPQEVTVSSDGFAQYRKRLSAPAFSIRSAALLAAGDSSNSEDDQDGSSAPRRRQKRRSVAQKELLKANLGLKVAADVE